MLNFTDSASMFAYITDSVAQGAADYMHLYNSYGCDVADDFIDNWIYNVSANAGDFGRDYIENEIFDIVNENRAFLFLRVPNMGYRACSARFIGLVFDHIYNVFGEFGNVNDVMGC